MTVDLRRRQPDAGRGIHGLEHVVDPLQQRGIEGRHRQCAVAQPRVWEFKDLEQGHQAHLSGKVIRCQKYTRWSLGTLANRYERTRNAAWPRPARFL